MPKKKFFKMEPISIEEELEEILPGQVMRRGNGDVFIRDIELERRRRRLRTGRTNPVPLKKRIRIHTGL